MDEAKVERTRRVREARKAFEDAEAAAREARGKVVMAQCFGADTRRDLPELDKTLRAANRVRNAAWRTYEGELADWERAYGKWPYPAQARRSRKTQRSKALPWRQNRLTLANGESRTIGNMLDTNAMVDDQGE